MKNSVKKKFINMKIKFKTIMNFELVILGTKKKFKSENFSTEYFSGRFFGIKKK